MLLSNGLDLNYESNRLRVKEFTATGNFRIGMIYEKQR